VRFGGWSGCSSPPMDSRNPVRSRGSGPAVGTVGGGVRLASEVRCEQVGVTIGDFWGARWLTCSGLCVSGVRKRVGA